MFRKSSNYTFKIDSDQVSISLNRKMALFTNARWKQNSKLVRIESRSPENVRIYLTSNIFLQDSFTPVYECSNFDSSIKPSVYTEANSHSKCARRNTCVVVRGLFVLKTNKEVKGVSRHCNRAKQKKRVLSCFDGREEETRKEISHYYKIDIFVALLRDIKENKTYRTKMT